MAEDQYIQIYRLGCTEFLFALFCESTVPINNIYDYWSCDHPKTLNSPLAGSKLVVVDGSSLRTWWPLELSIKLSSPMAGGCLYVKNFAMMEL